VADESANDVEARSMLRWVWSPGDRAQQQARIESVGVCVPVRRTRSRTVGGADGCGGPVDVEQLSGIGERRECVDGEDSRSLAIAAATDCLEQSAVAAEDLEVLMFCGISKTDGSCRLYRGAPTLAAIVAAEIGARAALPIDVGNACAGMLTGIYVLDDLIRRGVVRSGMVVSGEHISPLAREAAAHVTGPTHPEAATLTLGDAGAAVILQRADGQRDGIVGRRFVTLAEHAGLCTARPRVDAPGVRMLTQARSIHYHAIRATPFIVRSALCEAGIAFEDIDHVVMHQTAQIAIKRCASWCAEVLGSDAPSWVVNVDRFGNTASTAQILALHGCLREGSIRPGQRVLLIAQASGIVVGALVVIIGELGAGRAGAH